MSFSQFKKLSFWNKAGAIGSIASIVGLILFFVAPAPIEIPKNSYAQLNSNGSTQISNYSGTIIVNSSAVDKENISEYNKAQQGV